MSLLRTLLSRLRLLPRRTDLESDMHEEFEFHIEMETERLVRSGVPEGEAGRLAVLAFGGVEGHREAVRDGWRIPIVETAVREGRVALRSLRRSPAYAGAVLITMGAAVGAAAAVFTVVDALLVRPLPYPEAERIHTLWADFGDGRTFGVTQPEALELPGRIAGVEHFGVWAESPVNLAGEGAPEQVRGVFASAGLFDVLAEAPVLGRPFTAEEDRPGFDDVAVLSHGLWSRRFGADPAVLGRAIRTDGRTRTIIGVMGAGFGFPRADVELWVPLAIDPASPNVFDRYLRATVRLADGADPSAVARDARRVGSELAVEIPDLYGMRNVVDALNLVPLREIVIGDVRGMLLVILSAVSLVLLIACSNVANLTLARREARMGELRMRATLGGSRARLLGVAIAEGLILAATAGVMAAALAWLGVHAFINLAPPDFPRLSEVGVGPVTLAAAVGSSIVVGGVASLLAWAGPTRRQTRRPLPTRDRAHTASLGARRVRQALVVSQLGLALALLAGSGLLVRSLGELLSVNPGFRAEQMLTGTVLLPAAEYPVPELVPEVHQRLVEAIAAEPGVRTVASSSTLPMTGGFNSLSYRVEGEVEDPDRDARTADHQVVTGDYFEAMGIPLRAGRGFTDADRSGTLTVIVSEALAREAWPEEDAIGRRIHLGARNDEGEREFHTVVGVADNVLHHGPTVEPRSSVYFPNRALPWGDVVRGVVLVVRAEGDPYGILPGVRRAIATIDPNLPLARVRKMDDVVSSAVVRPRLVAFLLSAFAGVGLIIASAGVYGLFAYTVSCRSREFGVRLALGESPAGLRQGVVREAGALVLIGCGVGTMLFLISARLVAGLLHGVSAYDPLALLTAAVVLSGAAFAATYRPALLASRTDPGKCLRVE